jgi:hypothetical protein
MEKHPISDLAIEGNCSLFGKGPAKGTKHMDCRPIHIVVCATTEKLLASLCAPAHCSAP